MKVPPSMMNPAGKIAFTPHIERYLPTRGPEGLRFYAPLDPWSVLESCLDEFKISRTYLSQEIKYCLEGLENI